MHNQKEYLDGLCDQIDASVFSGDAVHHEEIRELLKGYIGRWQRAIRQGEEIDAEENGTPVPKPDLTLPANWKTEYHVAGKVGDPKDKDPGYLIRSPRINGVAANTFVWAGAENPAERLLYLILSTHNTVETE